MARAGRRTAVSAAASAAFITTCASFIGRMQSPLTGSRARSKWPNRSGQRVEVTVVVVLVADDHGGELGQLPHGPGDGLARVVGRGDGEPGVGEDDASADLDQVAARA